MSLAEGSTLGNDLKARLLPWPVVPPVDSTQLKQRLRRKMTRNKHTVLSGLLHTVRGYVSKRLLANNFEGLASLK